MSDQNSLAEIQKKWHGTIKSYVIGFFASILLTGLAFYLTLSQLIKGQTLIVTLAGLGIVQAIIQLIFFLHVGKEDKPRWELLLCLFMVGVLFVIVLGSLWIMYDLNNRVMAGME